MGNKRPAGLVLKSPDEQLAEARRTIAAHLAGTLLRPTAVCRECRQPALVKQITLEVDEGPGMSGTTVGVTAAICLDNAKECGCVAVQDGKWRRGLKWRYGSAQVKVYEGDPYTFQNLPVPFTARQRQRMEQFMDETDPNRHVA